MEECRQNSLASGPLSKVALYWEAQRALPRPALSLQHHTGGRSLIPALLTHFSLTTALSMDRNLH